MKKTYLLTCLLFLITYFDGQAQTNPMQFFGGISSTNMVLNVTDGEDSFGRDYGNKIGFQAGVRYSVPFYPKFSFEPAPSLVTKGYDDRMEFFDETITAKANIFYLDLPLHVVFRNDLGAAGLDLLFGPYLSVGLSGRVTGESTFFGETESFDEKIEWGSGENELSRLDYGLSGGAGISYNAWTLRVIYARGFANISNTEDVDLTHRVLAFTVGFSPW